jgi:hypothetical protein
MKRKNIDRKDHSPALKEFVSMIAGMKTYEEFGKHQPETRDWIETLSNLIVSARNILGDDNPRQKKTVLIT